MLLSPDRRPWPKVNWIRFTIHFSRFIMVNQLQLNPALYKL